MREREIEKARRDDRITRDRLNAESARLLLLGAAVCFQLRGQRLNGINGRNSIKVQSFL